MAALLPQPPQPGPLGDGEHPVPAAVLAAVRTAAHASPRFLCHIGVPVDGTTMVVPTAYGVDGDLLYLHGSVASRSLVQAPDTTVCVTVTHVDGLVLAR
ncbi:pyridoxamine 5'-phosphate oxidase family protein, partial [Streptomyces sp. adm13(2018)]|uniref:pyridoxamine 5'-phosphate oxidase family protein n=1 Tax=Streptomyces sp. adm13(2018) TaxID=2479007 RepID=UPI003967639A